jgi:hypothetical protein
VKIYGLAVNRLSKEKLDTCFQLWLDVMQLSSPIVLVSEISLILFLFGLNVVKEL